MATHPFPQSHQGGRLHQVDQGPIGNSSDETCILCHIPFSSTKGVYRARYDFEIGWEDGSDWFFACLDIDACRLRAAFL